MERIILSPATRIAHDLNSRRLRIEVDLSGVDPDHISLDMKKESFCITAPRNGSEYSGCFILEHQVEPEKAETRYEDGVLRITTPFKESGVS
ncbi:MAG: Hsp20/alpha crystallin family protein [Thermodesulfobacteriota bacterium]